jgi:DHA2 family multidrug resistance protein
VIRAAPCRLIDKGKELDWFGSTQIVVLAIVAVVGFAFFLAWELTEEHPIVDLRLFAGRNFRMGTLALAVAYALFFGNVVLLPLWLQQYMGYTATWAGLATAPVGILAIIISPWVGKNVGQIDARKLTTVAFLGSRSSSSCACTSTCRRTLHHHDPDRAAGRGDGLLLSSRCRRSSSRGWTPDRPPAAAGGATSRITAGAIGTSLFTTVWENRAVLHHAELAENISNASNAATATLGQLGASGLDPSQALAMVNRIIDQQAYTLAVDDLFFLSGMLFVVLLVLVWATKPAKNAAVDAAGAH